MSFKEVINKKDFPKGNIKIVLHKGGFYIPESGDFSKDAEIIEVRSGRNLIVDLAYVLIASVMHPSATNSGLQYLAVGTGYGTGSEEVPEVEDASYVTLREELGRKLITTTNYLDSGGVVSATATNRLQLITTFNEGEVNGNIVEMGFFGGTATSSPDSGILFNYKSFPVITKTNLVKMTIVWDISF